MQMPGLTQNFTYEEFHPNHELDIQRRTMDFLEDWFQRKFDTYSWELDEVFVLPDGRKFSKEEVLGKIGRVFESYSGFNAAFHPEKLIWFRNICRSQILNNAGLMQKPLMQEGFGISLKKKFLRVTAVKIFILLLSQFYVRKT